MFEPANLRSNWRVTRKCSTGACVEVDTASPTVGVRSSVHPDGPILEFDPDSWADFIESIKSGEFTPDPAPGRPDTT